MGETRRSRKGTSDAAAAAGKTNREGSEGAKNDSAPLGGPYGLVNDHFGREGERIEAVSDISEYTDDSPNDQVPGADESPVPGDEDWNEGVVDRPFTAAYEQISVRDDLAERFEGLIAAAHEWLLETDDPDAQGIYDGLVDLAERLGPPLEETDLDDETMQ